MKHHIKPRLSGLRPWLIAGVIGSGAALYAQTTPPATQPESGDADTVAPSPTSTVQTLDPFAVIGSSDRVFSLPGSAYYLDTGQITNLNYTNIDDVLRQIPGVYTRGEDGYGNFPNISIRGANPGRSSSVTMMEDGVLSAPAPYSAPAVYNSPNVARMYALEVLKGSSQVKYGPHTTGGVLNYTTTPIPTTPEAFGRFSYGNYNDYQTHLWAGGRKETEIGTFGGLLEFYNRQTDGFKTLDSTPAFNAGDANTGFNRKDYMMKLSFEPNWNTPNYFEFKLSYEDFMANETYLGLSQQDFNNTPNRRYAASRNDQINTYGFNSHLRHIIELTPDIQVKTTAYWQKFQRNWFKLHELRAGGALPAPLPLSQALFNGTPGYDILTGVASGTLRYRNNNRSYELYGIQSQVDWDFETGPLTHILQAGIRLHRDYEDRFQNNVDFIQNAGGAFTGSVVGAPGSQDNRRGTSTAVAVYVEDRMEYEDWAFIPGIRMEFIDYQNVNRNTGASGSTSLVGVMPGLGVEYNINQSWMVFGGYYRGFSPPGPGAATQHINNPTLPKIKPETTNSFELGARYRAEGVRAELVGFYTFFDDLIIPENIGTGVPRTENAGKVESRGVELLVGVDPATIYNWGNFRTPVTLAFTYTNAVISSNTASQNAESIFSGAVKGNRVPYIPEFQVNLTTGIEYERWRGYMSVSYVDSTFASANNSSAEINPNTGVPDARFGTIPSYVTVDFSAYYRVWREVELFAYIQNAFDDEYMVSRLPHGPRPGAPRTFGIGLQARF